MAVPGDVTLEGKIEWGEGAVPLKHFVDRYGVPNIGKVVKGQYRDVGVAKSVHSELFIHSVQISQKVLAEGVKVKEGRRVVVAANQKYSLPLTYQGWFELLSQDGKAVKAISSVADLARAFPGSVLIRESFKAFIPRETGEISLDKVRVLQSGEQVNLVGEVWVTVTTSKGMMKRCLLHCLDMQGESIYMPMEQKGLFSPIAGQTNISGVHSLRGLLDKFRMPILVRLVHGVIPSKLEKHFTGVFKLQTVYTEESAFVCPMKKDAKMLPISTREPLKLVASSNYEALKDSDECKYHIDRCDKMIASYLNSIHLLFSLPEPNAIIPRVKEEAVNQPNSQAHSAEAVEENILFEEVEDIYAYVREGGPVPPPPRPRPVNSQAVQVVQSLSGSRGSLKAQPNNHKQRMEKPQPDVKKQSPKVSKAANPQTKPILPIPLATPSPVPSPIPAADFQPTKDDYWEEPIYEPLDKIRQMKKGKKIEEKIPVPVVLSHTPAQKDSPEPPMAVRNKSDPNKPVQNLRQMYKINHDPDSSNYSIPRPTSNDNDIEELREILDDMEPPPVPPKKYHETDKVKVPPDQETTSPKSSIAPVQSPISNSKERLEQEAEKTMAFESESVISENDIALSSSSPNRSSPTSPTVVNSTIPSTPGGPPVVTVHTPMVARATVTSAYSNGKSSANASNSKSQKNNGNISNSQPTLMMNSRKSPSPTQQSLSQSHERLTSPKQQQQQQQQQAQQPTTYVYTTVPPADYPNHNGYKLARQNSHKVLLNKPKEPHEKQLLNRRGVSNGTPITAVKVNPSKSHVLYSRSGSGSGNNRTSIVGSYPNQQAPFVAVARVGESGTGMDVHDTRASIMRADSRKRMMHSMYL